ncbi:NgoBV family restriction endonuclease [Clostridium perfringens]|nr:NgoBV family restriction endonuclease [Clostridium perfringens]
MIKLTADKLYNRLKHDLVGKEGSIKISFCGLDVEIDSTDTVGNSLQSWLEGYLKEKNIYYRTPDNTQEFPDFYLGENNKENLLEVKAFNLDNGPGFDIANFESYCSSLESKSYRLDADYLIIGYRMNGVIIKIENIWLKKIWEISSSSSSHKLKVQTKRGMIYNIRPCTWYSTSNRAKFKPFTEKKEFIEAIHETISNYKNTSIDVDDWYSKVKESYLSYYGEDLK